MAHIVVIGGGLVGLTTGILLARDGHQVTVTERDTAGPRGNAMDLWQRWDRRGVNQFRQLHYMLPRWRIVMERELPEVIGELEALGGVRTSMLGALPDEMTGGKRDGDERFETVTGRRPVVEAAVAAVAKRTDGLTLCRGVAVTGLVTAAESIAGVPHVAGVTIGGATELHADLVVDATGRRSPMTGLLASKALYAAAPPDPDVLRAYTALAAMTAMPGDALAEPGLLEKVISLGSTAPRYPAPGPSRAELLAALG